MAVIGAARELEGERHKSESDDGNREYRRKFVVDTNNYLDDANVALGAVGIPQRYFPYITSTSVDLFAKCTERRAEQQKGAPTVWFVEVTYSTEHKDEEEEDDNPLLEPPEINWTFETSAEPIWGTRNQNIIIVGSTGNNLLSGPIKTSAGEIIDPPPTRPLSRPVVTITRNETQWNVDQTLMYQNAVNSDTFFGAPKRTAMCRSITGSFQSKKGVNYWAVTYTIAFNRDTWDLMMPNYGSFYLANATDTSPTYFETGNVRHFGLLNENGTRYVFGSTDPPKLLRFRHLKELPFSSLNLPLGPNR